MLDVNGHTKVTIQDDVLVVESYKNTDPGVVSHFKRIAEDELTLEVDRALGVGVRAIEAAGPILDVGFVQRTFDETVQRQRQVVEEAKRALMADLLRNLTPLFGDNGSVQRGVERALREALDVTDESRGLGRILKAIRKSEEESRQRLTELMVNVGRIVERREEREGSTKKGTDFEREAFEELARIATVHGDSPESTGAILGEGGRRRGDAVITIDSSVTNGTEIRVVAEAIDRANPSQKAVLKELDEAKENRAAVSAIAILASREIPAACGQVIQRHTGSRYVCVLDKETWNTLPLEVAYWAARLDALKAIEVGPADQVDLEAASNLVEEAIGHLGELDRLRAKLGASRNAINDAEGILSEVEGKLTRCLSRVAAILTGAGA